MDVDFCHSVCIYSCTLDPLRELKVLLVFREGNLLFLSFVFLFLILLTFIVCVIFVLFICTWFIARYGIDSNQCWKIKLQMRNTLSRILVTVGSVWVKSFNWIVFSVVSISIRGAVTAYGTRVKNFASQFQLIFSCIVSDSTLFTCRNFRNVYASFAYQKLQIVR